MVNKIKVENLIAQLESCDCFEITGESPLLNSLSWDAEVTGDPDNQVCLISWIDDEGLEYSVILTEQGLSDARVCGHRINCDDHEGEPIEIALWRRVGWPTEELMKHGDNLDISVVDKL
jgi:hypothetical protein